MNYKKYLRWGIRYIIFIIFLTIANYKVFGFEFTIMYLMLEVVTSIMGIRLELIRLLDKKTRLGEQYESRRHSKINNLEKAIL